MPIIVCYTKLECGCGVRSNFCKFVLVLDISEGIQIFVPTLNLRCQNSRTIYLVTHCYDMAANEE